jgi:hypothetical protein
MVKVACLSVQNAIASLEREVVQKNPLIEVLLNFLTKRQHHNKIRPDSTFGPLGAVHICAKCRLGSNKKAIVLRKEGYSECKRSQKYLIPPIIKNGSDSRRGRTCHLP